MSIENWEQKVLKALLNEEGISRDELQNLGGLAILSADTDKIKDYVFESSRLPEIRGASLLLDELNRHVPRNDYNPEDKPLNIQELFLKHGLSLDCIAYAAGGSLLALIPVEINGNMIADRLCQDIETLYSNRTLVATISCVWQPVRDLTILRNNFGRLMDAQTLLLRRRKEGRFAVPFFEALPHQRRCDSCGTRPASAIMSKPRGNWLCRACVGKRSRSQDKMSGPSLKEKGKREWKHHFEREWLLKNPSNETTTRYLKDSLGGSSLTLDDIRWEQVKSAIDLEEIAKAGRDTNLIGFVYADGDGVGRFIESSVSVEEYKEKSKVLHKLIDKSVFSSLTDHLHVCRIEREDGEEDYIHPFEILTIGGDDLLLIVPGDVAVPIAMDICKGFKQELDDQGLKHRSGRLLTMSAGVVVAHLDNPVRYMRDLAEQLLKNAKKRARQSPDESAEGAIDFLVLKSQSMLWNELRDLRRNVYEYPDPSGKNYMSLVGRPYLLSEMELLLRHARLLRNTNFPRSQSQEVRKALREGERFGRMWPMLWYLRQQARLPSHWKRLMHYIDIEWKILENRPWRFIEEKRNKRYYSTIWEDLHELRELLPGKESEPPSIQKQTADILRQLQQQSKEGEAYAG